MTRVKDRWLTQQRYIELDNIESQIAVMLPSDLDECLVIIDILMERLERRKAAQVGPERRTAQTPTRQLCPQFESDASTSDRVVRLVER